MTDSHLKIEAALKKKKEKLSVKVTTHLNETRITSFIHGQPKNNFFDDCIKRNWRESKTLKNIIETYYHLVKAIPGLEDKEFKDIKNILMANNPIRKAKVKSSGKIIQVYKLLLGGWCDYADCTTKYLDNQLEFI